MSIYAKVIADSMSQTGIRLTSMEVCFHRFILPEVNTHKVLSRNYRSSRAVPVKKLIEEVRTNPAYPVQWLKNKPGMQATEPMKEWEITLAKKEWLGAANDAADRAEELARIGLHKQWANRGLEPYLYVYGIITATEWANFFALRRHSDAQPEFKVLADAMWQAREESTPRMLLSNEWHLPYVTDEERLIHRDIAVKLSVARCARVSYRTHDGRTPSLEEDLALYDRLVGGTPPHASPAEHQACPDFVYGRERELVGNENNEPVRKWVTLWKYAPLHGNFTGWVQYRKTLPNECVRDDHQLVLA